MEPITLPIYNSEGKQIDSVKLNAAVFDGSVNQDSLYQAVVAYRAGQRKGLASTKTRGEVSGGGVKPWRQKGTGRARVGSIRSPLWRHGGVIFGPHPRNFYYRLPKKLKSLALKSSLNAKVKEGNFVVLDELRLDKPKTKEAARVFSNLMSFKPAGREKKYSTLLLLDKLDKNLKLALRNISFLDVNAARDTHSYEVLAHRKIIITKGALEQLTNRLK
ncbi:MAG: 50S ribosomal protein L4 [Candidatus Omnitrophota bacterium]